MQNDVSNRAPILLFGMPRSGTTWIGKIFDSHPDTLYRHEPDSFGRMNFLPLAPALADAPTFVANIRDFYEGLPWAFDTKIACTAPVFSKSYLSPAAAKWNRVAIAGARGIAKLTGELRAPLVLSPQAIRRSRLVTKSIESIARVGVIARAIPEARVVLILRHPYGFLASMLRGKQRHAFTNSDTIGEDLGVIGPLADSEIGQTYGLTRDELAAMGGVERLAWEWVLANDKALIETQGLDNVTVVRYEDVCAETFAEITRLFNFCQLGLTDQTRRFLECSTSVHEHRYYGVFKDPQRTVNAWRDELDEVTCSAARSIVAQSRAGALFERQL